MDVDKIFRRRKSNYGMMIPSFLVGALIGAGIYMFANSRSGDLIESMRDTGDEIKDRIGDLGDRARYEAGRVVGRTEEEFKP